MTTNKNDFSICKKTGQLVNDAIEFTPEDLDTYELEWDKLLPEDEDYPSEWEKLGLNSEGDDSEQWKQEEPSDPESDSIVAFDEYWPMDAEKDADEYDSSSSWVW